MIRPLEVSLSYIGLSTRLLDKLINRLALIDNINTKWEKEYQQICSKKGKWSLTRRNLICEKIEIENKFLLLIWFCESVIDYFRLQQNRTDCKCTRIIFSISNCAPEKIYWRKRNKFEISDYFQGKNSKLSITVKKDNC